MACKTTRYSPHPQQIGDTLRQDQMVDLLNEASRRGLISTITIEGRELKKREDPTKRKPMRKGVDQWKPGIL